MKLWNFEGNIEKFMIHIIIDKGSKRFVYVCEILFRYILKTPYRFTELAAIQSAGRKKMDHEDSLIIYSEQANMEGIRIPVSGLLSEEFIREEWEHPGFLDDMPVYFKQSNQKHHFPFDLFAASFYILTEYEKQLKALYDEFGRYKEDAYPSFEAGIHKIPLVHEYAEILWAKLMDRNPNLKRETPEFRWEVGVDVDHPWAFQHKGVRAYFGGFKDLLNGNLKRLKLRIKSLTGQKDPYDTFELISQVVPENSLGYFFLLNRESKLDGFHTYENKAYRKLIRDLKPSSFTMGIHPSYTSFLSRQAINMEKDKLEEIIGHKVRLARQHFLRYRLPKTRQAYLNADISHDYNGCLISDCGFKNGMAIAFPWFDLTVNEMTPLLVHPVMAMDVSLKDYMKLDTNKALIKLQEVIDITWKYKGTFHVLWHNSSLSEFDGWEGWKDLFCKMIDYLKED